MTEFFRGMVVSGYGGFYQVRIEDSRVINCKARGKLKKKFSKIYSGDMVEISLEENELGNIENIRERHMLLPRPNIANVDRLLLILCKELPAYDLLIVDRMLAIARKLGISSVICFNKIDTLSSEQMAELQELACVYTAAGCTVTFASAKEHQGIEELRSILSDGITVLAGQSGVGKSSLLNCLLPQENAETGDVSLRLQRGKHTTRYTRILPLDDAGRAFIADTPGFFTLELPYEITERDLASLYPEFAELYCRFDTCVHNKEPDCGIKEAVKDGSIDKGRYERYLSLLTELHEREVIYR